MADLSEKEQLDAMKAWWADNRSFVIGGIAAGLIIIFGWNHWQSGIADSEIEASTLYEDVMHAAALNVLDLATEPSARLFADYGDTEYAALARLAMARMYMESARDQDAANVLQDLIDAAPDSEVAFVGRLRLAKVLLYQGKAEEALALLQGYSDTAFAARYNELRGDALAELKRYDEAEAAYIASLNDDQSAPTVDAAMVQLKINDLPAQGEIAAAAEAAGLDAPAAENGPAENDTTPPDGDGEDSAAAEDPESD